jgi:hypothetical protein
MTLYRKILGEAWVIAWRNKYLWFFGLFATILIGNGPEFEVMARAVSEEGTFTSPLQAIYEAGLFSFEAVKNMAALAVADTTSFILAIGMLFLVSGLTVFVLWLSVVSQAAIVSNSAAALTGKEHNLQSGVNAGLAHFWKALWLNVFNKGVIVFLVLLLSLLASLPSLPGAIYLMAFIVFVPAVIVISLLIKYAIAYAVVRGDGFLQSLRSGAELFRQNWIISLEMAFTLFLINLVAAFLLIFALAALYILSIAALAIVYKVFHGLMIFRIFFLLTILIFVVIISSAGAILSTFQTSAWTSLFVELVGRGGSSKIERLFGRLRS